MKAKIRLIITTLVILLTGIFPVQVFAEDYTASTMRLLRHEGTVEITDASGKKRAVLENVRFSSGEAITTGKESTASVGLDSDKVITMDELSRVEFKKKANNMELTLTDGQLLLDVQKKLDKEEKLDIRTSTMTISIRGTIIYLDTGNLTGENASAGESASPTPAADTSSTAVSSDTGSKASVETTRLGVLEGTVEVKYVDVNGELRTIKVPAGNKMTLTDANRDGMADIEPVTEELESIDFNAFLLKQISNNPDLKERLILLDSLKEALNPDESVYKTEITLVAQSASKLYDGTPLTRTGDVLVYGLPEKFTVRASAGGSITDAGSTSNPISSYAIFDAVGTNVTSQVTNVTTVNGTLTVNLLPVTFNLSLFEATEYSGEPICPEWIEGYYDDVSPVEYVDDSSEYIETDGIWTATSGLFNLIGGGQIYIRANGVRDVGNHTIKPTEEFRAGKANNYDITYEENTMNITPLELIVKTGTKSKEYDGTPLTDPTITLEGLTEVDEGKVTARATGKITDVGDTPNTYEISWGSVNPANYSIIEELDTLMVTGKLGLALDDSLTGAASTLSGISLLNSDTVKRILKYIDPVTPGTLVNHIDETDPSDSDNGSPASQGSSESNAETAADSSASISPTSKPDPTAKPGTSPTVKPDPTAKSDTGTAVTDDSDVSAVHESGIVPPSDDSRVSDPEIPENTESESTSEGSEYTESGSTSDGSGNTDSSVSQTDSSIAGTGETDSSSQAGDSTNAVSTADSSLALPISVGN
ncbi:MAG: FecR domain-containing protein [Lachnospiraceae bacterium]|nr:FecR domain-containing protein [Lachnospiraceae bacterium]